MSSLSNIPPFSWWRTHRARKHAKEVLHHVRRLLGSHRDLMKPDDVAAAEKAIAEFAVVRRGSIGQIEQGMEKLEKACGRLFPTPKHPRLRETIEIALVAAVVAWGGIRTFFLQPFKIPTGSMQPTLYGIHKPGDEFPPGPNYRKPLVFPLSFFDWLLFGRSTGRDGLIRITGDHIFVDKVTYNFRKPRRGEVIVFQTRGIEQLDQDKFYIKRCAGLPGETMEIREPFLFVDGRKVEGGPFDRIYSLRNGYHGYVLPQARISLDQTGGRAKLLEYQLSAENPSYRLPDDQYYALGDNSRNSLDSRYWGGVPHRNLVGKAFWTYWPSSRRWGLAK